MQAVMTSSQPDWQPDNTTRSSYRDAPHSEASPCNSADEQSSKRTGPTIREIRESMAATEPPRRSSVTMTPQRQVPKKKPSIFGSLFATKEPTQIALNQVAAQMVAQHGSTSAVKVPHVRMEKMPGYVPKVNTKWDGVPETIKEREKREKDRQKALKRQSALRDPSRPGSVGSSERRGRAFASTNSSFRDQSASSRAVSDNSHNSDPRSPNPHKFYAQSVNSSGDLASQQRPEGNPKPSKVYSGSLHSRSEVNIPQVTSSAPEQMPRPPTMAEPYRSSMSIRTKASVLNGSSRASKASRPSMTFSMETAPSIDVIPEHTSSPAASPRDGSPATPLTQQTFEPYSSIRANLVSSGGFSLESSGLKVLDLPVPSKKAVPKRPGSAFLAGEARPLELPDDDESPPATRDRELPLRQWGNSRHSFLGPKGPEPSSHDVNRIAQDLSKRPDSSRARLGMQPTMRVRTDAAPWQAASNTSALSPWAANARSRTEVASPRQIIPASVYRDKGS